MGLARNHISMKPVSSSGNSVILIGDSKVHSDQVFCEGVELALAVGFKRLAGVNMESSNPQNRNWL